MIRRAIIRRALYFDGVDDHVKVLNHPSLSPARISVMAWIKPAKPHTGYEKVVCMSRTASTTEYVYTLSYDNVNRMRFMVYTAAQYLVASISTMPTHEWTHIAGVYDGSSIRIYVNAVLERSIGVVGNLESSTKDLYIGAREDLAGRYNGLIHEVRIYNRALRAEEIKYHYESTKALFV